MTGCRGKRFPGIENTPHRDRKPKNVEPLHANKDAHGHQLTPNIAYRLAHIYMRNEFN